MYRFLLIPSLFLSLFTLTYTQDINEKHSFDNKYNGLKKVNYPGDSNIDVTYYKLDLKITATPEYLSGTATIKAKPNSGSINSVFLDLADNMQINDIRVNNHSVSFTHSDFLINITLDKTYSANELISIEIDYEGRPEESYWGSFAFRTVEPDSIKSIWSLSEPYGASAWWPCKDTPADKADSSDVWLTVEDNMVGVSNGILEQEINLGNGFKTYKWKSRYPIAQYLISIAIAPYQVINTPWEYEPGKFMDVIHYVYPDSTTRSTRENLEATVDMLSVYSDLFGLYPFVNEKYGHAEWRWGGAMEHQTCTTTGYFYQDIVAHELAHQWFGDKITCKDWNNIWLNEGFATYCEILYEEVKNGYKSAMTKFKSDYYQALNANGPIYVSDEDINPNNPSAVGNIFDGNRSYAKGGVVLHMLRGVVGDVNFFNILKTYIADLNLAYNVAVTADFQQVAEEVSGMDLDYFFDEWIYGENYPVYYASWSNSHYNESIYNIALNITQSNNTSPVFFTMPVPIHITTTMGDTTIIVTNDQQNQNFTLQVFGRPTSLEIDPENWILKEVGTMVGTEKDEAISLEFRLEQNYPNPFNPETHITYTIPISNSLSSSTKQNSSLTAFVELALFDVLGKKVKTLVNEYKAPGKYEITFNAENLSSGVYYYRLTSGSYTESKKMILVK